MKRIICILVLCLTFVLTSCDYAVFDNNINSSSVGNCVSENTKDLEVFLNNEYDIFALKNYFNGKSVNEPHYLNGASQNLSFNDVNERFPVEYTSSNGYSVYKVCQGGYFYVFWSHLYTSGDTLTNDRPYVYFTSYIPSSKDSNEFDSIIAGKSTAKDVKSVDPYFELNFLISNGIYSFSYLNEETVMQIQYERKENMYGYDDLIVKSKTVVARDSAPSKYSTLLSSDIP